MIKLSTTHSASSYGHPVFIIDGKLVDYCQGLRAARESLCLSRAQLADLLGVSARTVEAWEQGLRNPSKSALLLLKKIMAEQREIENDNCK